MSQYGSPPPPGEPGDDSTRVPGQRQPGATPSTPSTPSTPTPSWERPTRGPSEPDPWDQPATPPSGSPAQQTQQMPPAPSQAAPQQPSWDQPQPGAQQPPSAPSYDQGYAASYPQQGYQQGYDQQGQQDWEQQGTTGAERSPSAAAAEAKGLVGALLDFSFSTFVTGRIVKIVYVLGIVTLGLGLLGWLASAIATGSPLFIVFALVAGPIGFVVYLCFLRMTLELFLAITRMSEDVHLRMPDPGDRP